MLFFKTKVSRSTIEGYGLFAREAISRGAVIGNLAHRCRYISESDYSLAQARGDEAVVQTGIRYGGDKFLFTLPSKSKDRFHWRNEDFINHSSRPSLLYHCGMLFALAAIESGEELTVDYAYLLARDDATAFRDVETGAWVCGLEADQALRQSAFALAALLAPKDTSGAAIAYAARQSA